MKLYKLTFTVFFICVCISAYANEQADSTGSAQPQYSHNIIAAMPFLFSENGLGFGAGYERNIDKKDLFAFYIPAMVTFNVANTNRIYDYNTGMYSTGKTDPMFYTMPGIKFYPTGGHGRIKYATGASAVVAVGKQSNYAVDPTNKLNITELVLPHFLIGAMWQNSLNINVDAHMYLGAEVGLGGTLVNKAGGNNESSETLIQGNLKIGYRF